jgi:hypothetical protein
MQNFKYITLLFGIGICNTNCSNLSSSLNYKTNISVFVCDSYPMYTYENNYENNFSIVRYSYKETVLNLINIDIIIDILSLFFIVSSSLLCALVFVSNYVYSSMIKDFVDNYNIHKNMYEYDPYLFEYLDEFNNMKSSVLSVDFLNSLKYKFLKHNTPKGEIIMNYNHLYSSFDYYCKKSNIIEFNYLDVVSRIYVVKNNCKNIYIDKSENCDYGLVNDNDNDNDNDNVNDETYEDVTKDVDDAKEDVDATKENAIFYNKSNNKVKPNEKNTDYVSNTYKYKGTIEEFYSYCETNYYKIHYSDLLENSDSNYSIIFSIDKEETPQYNASKKINMRFKEFKKFQKF